MGLTTAEGRGHSTDDREVFGKSGVGKAALGLAVLGRGVLKL